ncbi:RGG repeats nuclear RNA binding protein A-like [Olea europaea var. sylvestris]|uniref:RGG repeats nuclear RNA binding protein A-like n=1 Tax=Olea europaea var. sylvestris TaxID=158386 RepID=UPI000C1D4E6B|nr:RGG repeats nuclear RNA binding protein A-like [Olea europaea var. sylvestris]
MATVNPFDLLGDDDTGDVSQLIAAHQQKPPVSAPTSAAEKKAPAQSQPAKPAAKLPSKPLPPAQAVREVGNGGPRGGGRGAGRGRGFNRESMDENTFGNNNGYSGRHRVSEEGDDGKPSERRSYGGPRGGGGFRGGRRGGFSNGDTAEGERPRRAFERRSGTGRGNEFKREGAGRGNWGTPTEDIVPEAEEPVNEGEKNVDTEKQLEQEDVGDANKDTSVPEQEEKEEPEEKEMTLEEYEKLREDKRKALPANKSEERKVDLDKEFESMQLLSNKKNDDEVFIKLGSEKDKRKEAAEKAKKSVNINEFLKPADGENYYRPGGRGRGRGRGRGGYTGNSMNNAQAPSIEDAGHFPSLGGK